MQIKDFSFPKRWLGLCLVMLSLTSFAQEAKNLNSDAFHRYYGSLSNTWFKIAGKKEVTVAFLGGSITENQGWRNLTQDYLKQTYPEAKFKFIDAGIGSLGSLPHSFRLNQDVIKKGPVDLLFLEAAVNDQTNGTSAITQQRALEGIVRHLLTRNPEMDIVFMAFADESKIADYQAGQIPQEVAIHDKIAKYYHLPFINLAAEVYQRIKNGEFTWAGDFKDVHPSPFGQDIYFNSIKTLLQSAWSKPVPKKIVKAKIPRPLDPYSYANADYKSISEATGLNGFVLDPLWKPFDEAGTRNRFVNVPMLVAQKAGSSLTFNFTGNAIGIAIISGPDAGIINYQIDNGPMQQLDCYTQWSEFLHLPWYLMLGDELRSGKHQLKITVSEQHNPKSKGTALRIVNFLVNQ